ncbi:hypothetical protein POF51_26155 [Brevibacillus sp. AG]|uniref:hypothetical protein n=1 Tax=Brevibacillus sp. AG TaxID=3020891 RepID=UPI00233022EE|nr:hypothetical protein [Brevibacillus sp. AG]MDC0764207.1 hypothetical protein [Brevibacillus sp. AG]
MENLSFAYDNTFNIHKDDERVVFHTCYRKEYQLVTGKIYSNVEDQNTVIGEVEMYLIDENWLESNVFHLAEKVDPRLLKAIRSVRFQNPSNRLHRDPNTCLVYGRIAVLTQLRIFEQYQSKGLENHSLEQVVEYLSQVLHVSFIIAPSVKEDCREEPDSYSQLLLEAGFEYTCGDKIPHLCKKVH